MTSQYDSLRLAIQKYLPGVQMPPVSLSAYMGQVESSTLKSSVPLYIGEGLFEKAPRLQYHPSAQSPLGSGSPAPLQYLPATYTQGQG